MKIIAQIKLLMSNLWVTNSFDCSSGVFSNVIVNFADVLAQRTQLGGICCRFTNLKQSKLEYSSHSRQLESYFSKRSLQKQRFVDKFYSAQERDASLKKPTMSPHVCFILRQLFRISILQSCTLYLPFLITNRKEAFQKQKYKIEMSLRESLK